MIDPERAAQMEALAEELDATVRRLDVALDRQEKLAAEVGDVRRRNRWLIAAIAVLGLIATGAVVAAVTAFNTAHEVRDLTAQQEVDRQAVNVSSCLVRNGATLSTDIRFNGMFDAIAGFNPNPDATLKQRLDILRNAGLTPLEQRYRDCDENGTVGNAGDFPPELAKYAPVPG